MCRSIHVLFNVEPPATAAETREAATQFVRKIAGYVKPSQANQAAFDRAVDEIAQAARRLLDALVSNAPPKDRAVEAAKARERNMRRYGSRQP